MTDTQQKLDRMNSGLYWWGIPTLFRCPHDPDPSRCDIALVGVPHSTGNGTTERNQHLGPRAVRDISAIGRRVHMAFGSDPWQQCRIHDLGDVALPEANDNEKSIARIADFYRHIAAGGARPVSIGGDHSVTGGIVSGISAAQSALTGGKKIALLHFDAHTDTFHHIEHFLGAVKSAAHWASYLVREDHVNPHNSIQVGIRGNPRTLDWLQPSRELGYEVVDIERYRQLGTAATARLISERIGDEPVYITFDLDCLDTTVAPGVANPEVGSEGLFINETMQLLRSLRGKNIIGGDVVCLMPDKDAPNKQTALTAMSVMFEMIALIADNTASTETTP